LPAQFFSSEGGSRAKSGETMGPAMIAERNLMKLLLSMVVAEIRGMNNFQGDSAKVDGF
jgi:hypothetical protein